VRDFSPLSIFSGRRRHALSVSAAALPAAGATSTYTDGGSLKRSAQMSTQLMFAGAIFVGATLLFTIQPLIARMIMPFLGGAPAVWIVCSLCFQMLLLAGYGYAHFVGTRLRVRGQVMLQLALVGAVFVVMPIHVDDGAARGLSNHPTLGILVLLLRTIGLPFFVLSTSSPLLQRWFAESGERDPYHLYAASNAGSMLALLGYPFVVEPLLSVKSQSRALHTAFALYAVIIVVCATSTLRRKSNARVDTTPAPPQVRVADESVPIFIRGLTEVVAETATGRWRERAVWIALSFAPSSLLLGATEYITTDIASVPLFWVLPLALYLMSFIVAFAKRQFVSAQMVSRALALVACLVAAFTLAGVAGPAWLLVSAHMLLLFLASVACHRALAARRPPVARLTEFYLLLSIGGVLGGLFNGIIAPFLFDDLIEYPIAIGLACLGRVVVDAQAPAPKYTREMKGKTDGSSVSTTHAIANDLEKRGGAASAGWLGRQLQDIGFGLGLGALTYAFVSYGASRGLNAVSSFGWMFGIPIIVVFVWAQRPVRYAVAIGAVLLAGMAHEGYRGKTLWADRGFYGVMKVTQEPENRYRLLVSGRTMHGKQAIDPATSKLPLAYYHPTGPVGDVLGPLPKPSLSLPPRRIGVIGLGIGTLAAYARAGDDWTFFEINPTVVDIARNQFTYLKNAEDAGAKIHLEVGDARLRLREGSEARFDYLVLDAFSSDAIPIHLVTREALEVYRRALRPGGILFAHVSNNHVNLAPVFGVLARDANLLAIGRADDANPELAKESSVWIILTEGRNEIDLIVRSSKEWRRLSAPESQKPWTDDHANVLGALRF
jgi:SAM-dependent methyltransferase